jgi:hypothetical protein
MKKIMLVSLVAIISGCNSTPITNIYEGESYTFATEDGYEKAVSCALEHITTPTSSNFFSYQSDKLQKYILTFNSTNHWYDKAAFGSKHWDVKATLSASFKDGQLTYKISNPTGKFEKYMATTDTTAYGEWGSLMPQELHDENRVVLERMLKSMVQCSK